MKAIPLIACLALVAVQGRAQNSPPADVASPAPTNAPPPSLADRARLLNEIKAFRHEQNSLPPGMEPKLNDLEREAGDTVDLEKTRKKFQDLEDDLLAGRQGVVSRGVPDDASKGSSKMETFADNTARVMAGARAGGQFYDGTTRSGSDPAPAAVGADESGAAIGAKAADTSGSSGPGTASKASLSDLKTNPPPEPAPGCTDSYCIDTSGISASIIRKMQTLKDGISQFTGKCYAAVQVLLVTMHVLTWDEVHTYLPHGAASNVISTLNEHPELLKKLHIEPFDLMKIDPNTGGDTIPERTLFVFAQKCERPDQKDGHIEYTLHSDKWKLISPLAFAKEAPSVAGMIRTATLPARPRLNKDSEVLACSDGCRIRTVTYYQDLYSRKGCLKVYAPVTTTPEQQTTAALNMSRLAGS